jgi:hypothetical protein
VQSAWCTAHAIFPSLPHDVFGVEREGEGGSTP